MTKLENGVRPKVDGLQNAPVKVNGLQNGPAKVDGPNKIGHLNGLSKNGRR